MCKIYMVNFSAMSDELRNHIRTTYNRDELLVEVAADIKVLKIGVNDAVVAAGTNTTVTSYEYDCELVRVRHLFEEHLHIRIYKFL